jgi:hypothetical protein
MGGGREEAAGFWGPNMWRNSSELDYDMFHNELGGNSTRIQTKITEDLGGEGRLPPGVLMNLHNIPVLGW